ncbi:alpha/beta hydrolase [Microbacterium sp. 179-I 3D4 NHS]|uniref:alpha/beta hydrolase n=1 Tax=Microbacterium sp. 179-I 3D4 NHS TaxID=3142381 RepID=UPI0039A1244B
MLSGELTEEQRAQLEGVRDYLDEQRERDPDVPVSLLCLFMDTTEEKPRATLGFGDVDGADQITTVSHGIETDLNSLEPWAASAVSMHDDLNDELARKGSTASSAVVLFIEWDSGGINNVLNIERPDGGAERLAQLQRGFQTTNPDAQLDLDLHSLGTTMAAQMMADNPGLVDDAWFFGSAGITQDAAVALERQIREGDLTLHVTHADDDWVAPIGRLPASEHPVDPRTIGAGVETPTGEDSGRPQIFSSNGGWVEDYRSPEGERGERTEGHNSQRSEELIYLLETEREVAPGVTLPIYHWDEEAVGYLDPVSQSYKQAIVDHVKAILAGEADDK